MKPEVQRWSRVGSSPKLVVALSVVGLLVAGCANLPFGASSAEGGPCEQNPTQKGCPEYEICQGEPTLRPCRERDAKLGVCPELSPNELVSEALRAIDAGEWARGEHFARCAMEDDPESVRALTLLEQIESDPVAFFSTRFGDARTQYVVQSNETLGTIAARCLKDATLFVSLAKLNGKRNPSQVGVGEALELPGAEPCPVEKGEREALNKDESSKDKSEKDEPEKGNPLLAQAEKAAKVGQLEKAYRLVQRAREEAPDDEAVANAYERIRARYVNRLKDAAYAARSKEEQIRRWKRVLEFEPDDYEAQSNLNKIKLQ